MRPHADIVLAVTALIALGGPLAMAATGLVTRRGGAGEARAEGRRLAWPWRLTIASALIYALAFNLVFFLQELFLVVPKALTPGLHPVLFHNNHDWTGSNPLAELEQGSGAMVALVVGLAALWQLRVGTGRSATLRLLVVWIAYNGLFDALPQAVAAAVLPGQDVGRAMSYLGLEPAAMLAIAVLALVAMAAAGMWLARPLLALADDPARVATRTGRTGFVFQVATLPAVLGCVLVLPFRVPADIVQVAVVPVVITAVGLLWIQASAWRAADVRLEEGMRPPSILIPLAALAVVLLVFQLVLRPGIAF